MTSGAPNQPLWLRKALEHRPRYSISDEGLRMPRPGQLWVARKKPGEEGHIVAILEVAIDAGYAEVALTSNELEPATDRDLLFVSQEVGTPFALRVETDVVGPVWLRQLEHYVGLLPLDASLIIGAALDDRFDEQLGDRRGWPLLGEEDWRWGEKLAEQRVLAEISSDCVSSLLAASEPAVFVDPAILPLASLAGSRQVESFETLLDALAAGADLEPRALEVLLEHDELSLEGSAVGTSWREFAPDYWAAMGPMIMRALTALGHCEPTDMPAELLDVRYSPEPTPGLPAADLALKATVAACARRRPGPCSIRSSPTRWGGSTGLVAQVAGGARVFFSVGVAA